MVGSELNPLTKLTNVPITLGDGHSAHFIAFNNMDDGNDHIALRFGKCMGDKPPLVRIHSECLTGDVFGSSRCDCGAQLHDSIDRIAAEGGYLLYMRQEGRGIGLSAKLEAYELQDQGYDTYAANEKLGFGPDDRSYVTCAQMLRCLGANKVRLLTNNQEKIRQLVENGIDVVERVPTIVHLTGANRGYLMTKKHQGNHSLCLDPVENEE